MLAACGGNGAHTFQAGSITVVDESGLVTSVSAPAPPAQPPEAPTTAAGSSLTQLVVTWAGSGCVDAWTVRLTGNALEMTIEPGPIGSGCAESRIAWTVQLQLNRAIDASGVDVTLSCG